MEGTYLCQVLKHSTIERLTVGQPIGEFHEFNSKGIVYSKHLEISWNVYIFKNL